MIKKIETSHEYCEIRQDRMMKLQFIKRTV